MSGQSAVMKRINTLTRQWTKFTDDATARVLRWRLDSNAGRFIDAFLAFHGDEASDLTDLFIPVAIPSGEDAYWPEVYETLVAEIDEAKADLAELELPTDWQPPKIDKAELMAKPAAAVIEMLASYQKYYADLFDHVAIVLMPESIEDRDRWMETLDEAFTAHQWPASVRIIVMDWTPYTMLQNWSESKGKRVMTFSPVLDIQGLPLEILSQLKTTGPGAEFRSLFVQLSAAANGGAVQRVQNIAERAIRVALDNQWFALVAAVRMVVGSTMSTSGDAQMAAEMFKQARAAAHTISVTDISRVQMMLVSGLSEAGNKLAGGEYREARNMYNAASKVASEAKNPNMAFESHRMACFCAQQSGDFEDAWFHAKQALATAKNLDSHAKRHSTVPHFMTDLERLAKRPGEQARNFDFERECQQVLGVHYHKALDAVRKLARQLPPV